MDWLGAIGGVEKVLLLLFGFIVSGFSNFSSTLEILNLMYFTKPASSQSKSEEFEDKQKRME